MMFSLSLSVWLLTFILGAFGSDITTYSDGACTKSFNNLHAVNGYPDGVCTPVGVSDNGTPKSFQLAKLDDGCAVTLYGQNEGSLVCSSPLKIVAEMGTCYNASWVYYSIDNCLQPGSTSIVLPASTPTPTPTPTPTLTPTSSPTPTVTASSNISSTATPDAKRTGVIVGGITGGVASFALIFGVALFLLRRSHVEKPLPSPPSYELSNEYALIEAARGSVIHPQKAHIEVFAHEAAAEIGRNSGFVYCAELPADPAFGDKKALHQYTRVEERDSRWI